MKDILAEMRLRENSFSKGQKALAAYILEHYDEAAFATARKVGRRAGVSESTVVRFAAELGCDGYPDMQRALQGIIRNKLTAAQRVGVTQNRLDGQDLIRNVMLADTEKIRATLESIDRAAFGAIVDALLAAETVYVIGIRSASVLSGFLAYYLGMERANVRLVSASAVSETVEQVLHISERDALIGISFPRYSSRTLRVMQYAKERGAAVCAISDSAESPICAIAEHRLLVKCDTSLFVDSLVAPLSLINALIVAVGLRDGDRLTETFARLEKLRDVDEAYERDR